MTRTTRLWLVAIAIGIVDALVLKGFEWAVNDGTHWLWDDAFGSNVHRWRVVPLAIVLSIALSALFVVTKQKRVVRPKTDLLKEESAAERPTALSILLIGVIGLVSLLAGASLGPEASLMALAGGLGLWLAYRADLGERANLLKAASIGGLLVAFVGSLIIGLLPLLELQQKKMLKWATAIPVMLACLSSFGTLWLMDHKTRGFGSIPAGHHFSASDFLLALLVGFVAALLGWTLKRFIELAYRLVSWLNSHLAWPVAAALLGLVVGLLYWDGGESIEFSGSQGSGLLLHHQPAYGLAALFVILVSKLLVTGWSLASGYRGGLVFPSVFMGVAVALIVQNIFGSAGPGVMIGAVAGVFGALTGPVGALIFIASIVPFKLIGIAIAGIIGSTIGNRALTKLGSTRP